MKTQGNGQDSQIDEKSKTIILTQSYRGTSDNNQDFEISESTNVKKNEKGNSKRTQSGDEVDQEKGLNSFKNKKSYSNKGNNSNSKDANNENNKDNDGDNVYYIPQNDTGNGVEAQLEDMEYVANGNSNFDDVEITPEDDSVDKRPQIRSSCCLLCPRLEPMPFLAFVSLTIFAAIPAVSYIIAFTKMGSGLKVFRFIDKKLYKYSYYLGLAVFLYTSTLYLVDCYYWATHAAVIVRRNLLIILAVLTLAFILSISSVHPYGPIGIILITTTTWMVSIRYIFFRNTERKKYISWLSGPLLFVSAVVALVWIIWTFAKDENEWTHINSLIDAEKVDCEPDFITYPQCDDGDGNPCYKVDLKNFRIEYPKDCDVICANVYDSCHSTFIVWAGPFLVSLGFFFLSFFASFLRTDGSTEQSVGKLAKIWMFLIFSIWVSASLAGAGSGVTATLAALTLAAFVASAVFLVAGYDTFEREEQRSLIWESIKEKYGSIFDPVRGLLIVTCTPIAMLYIFVSIFKQCIRRCNFWYQKPPSDTDSLDGVAGAGCVTIEARRLIRKVSNWDRAKVFTYAIYWGMAFMILSVIVAQFTIVLLSWLIEETTEMNIGTVTGILAAAGMIMFLLPPVPGVPIYLTLGIVIVPVGRELLGITGSIIYAMVISLCLKLTACTVQQKVFGGLLQHKVSVRQFVGINSKLIRSMKLVLGQKGFGIAKVAILVGGPDWPTSVLCGIMGLPLIPILVGTLPIIFLILPTLLTGSFTYMSGLEVDGQQEFPWATTMMTVCLAITSLVQFGSMIVAAFYIESAISTRGKELEAIPIDEEVKEADEKLEELNKAYSEVIQWQHVPIAAKILLSLSLVCMILCCYMVQLFADDCFAEYQLTYTIGEHLDDDWKNIVLPLGRIALILFAASVVLFLFFKIWAKREARKKILSISEGDLALK